MIFWLFIIFKILGVLTLNWSWLFIAFILDAVYLAIIDDMDEYEKSRNEYIQIWD